MKQGTEEWFVAMGTAIKDREHAEAGVARWEEKLAQAEHRIHALANGSDDESVTQDAEADVTGNTEQVPGQE